MRASTMEMYVLDFVRSYRTFSNATLFSNTWTKLGDSFLENSGITGLRIYNIKDIHTIKKWSVVRKNGTTTLYIPQEDFYLKSDVLECQPWFKYFIGRAFGCSSGRLYQYGGTCYLNTVINGMLLSEGTRMLLFETYNREKDDMVFTSLENLACPIPQTKTSKSYILNLVHNILCKGDKLINTGDQHDVLLEASKSIFSSNSSPDLPNYGDGGVPLFALQKILLSLNIPFLLRLPLLSTFGEEKFVQRCDVTKEDAVDESLGFEEIKSCGDMKTDQSDIIINWHFKNPRERRSNEGQLMFDTNIKIFDGVEYVLQFGIIQIFLADGNGHAIVGMICNGIPQIYDSGSNSFIHVDWRFMNVDKSIEMKTSEIIGKIFDRKVDKAGVLASVYMRKERYDYLKANHVSCNI